MPVLNESQVIGPPRSTLTYQNECAAEEQLIDQLLQLVHEFMVRTGRHYAYQTRMQWSVDHAKKVHFNVVVVVEEPVQRT